MVPGLSSFNSRASIGTLHPARTVPRLASKKRRRRWPACHGKDGCWPPQKDTRSSHQWRVRSFGLNARLWRRHRSAGPARRPGGPSRVLQTGARGRPDLGARLFRRLSVPDGHRTSTRPTMAATGRRVPLYSKQKATHRKMVLIAIRQFSRLASALGTVENPTES